MPNATVMVIENADRFGLGTITSIAGPGRARERSILLLSWSPTAAHNRHATDLMVLTQTNDGFVVAEKI